MIKRMYTHLVCTGALLLIATSASAQENQPVHPYLTSKWWVEAGVYVPNRKFTLAVNGTVAGINEEFEFDERVGLSERDPLFEVEVGWQFGEKWDISAQYFAASKDGRGTLDEDIEWEDIIYEVGADVRAGTEFSITRFVFSRKFRERGPHDLRIAAGIHWLDFDAFIEGQAQIDDMTSEFRRSSAEVSAPLPNIGAWYRYSPNEKWVFSLRVDWLDAKVGDLSGQILNTVAGINYSLFQNFGISLNYQRFHLDVKVREADWQGKIDMTFTGPNLAVSGYWP